MFEQFSASAITAILPNLEYTVPFYGTVDLSRIAGAFLVFVALTIVFWLLRIVILQRMKVLARKTKGDFDDVIVEAIEGIRHWVYVVVAFYAALQFFRFPEWFDTLIDGIFSFTVAWQLIEVASYFVNYIATKFVEKDRNGDGTVDPEAKTMSELITLIARIVLWALGALFILSNLGIEVTSLIAGLGIGGIAVAFALQGVLSDLFASFSIYFDKPFRIGDFIIIGDDMGTVEHIGIKSTRLRTLQGQELVMSNAELTTARVNNYKKMEKRRIVTEIGVIYETPQEKLRSIPDMIKRIFAALEHADLDRVHFASFGDFSLNFELVYYIDTPDYNAFMDVQQQFNYSLVECFAAEGIEFAYPTQVEYTKVTSLPEGVGRGS